MSFFSTFFFQPPHPDLQHGAITSYSVGYRLANSSEPYRYATVDARDPHVKKAYFSSSNYSSSSIRWFFGYACMSAPRGALQTLFTFSSLQTRLKWKIEQLKTFTKYAIILQAFNARGAGPKSEEVVVTTMEDGKKLLSNQQNYLPREA